MTVLVIDNYDSFTYNLVHYLRELGNNVAVIYNDKFSMETIVTENPSHIIISPGPGRPERAGLIVALIKAYQKRIPILGVCLGHQAIGSAAGAHIIKARNIMHGKTSLIYHEQQGIFANITMPFKAMRYHSLVIDPHSLPADFKIMAWTLNENNDKEDIMAIQHTRDPLFGVQFHPESIATEYGHQILQNFLQCQ
jgi:anthranilate synthase component 2